MCQSIDRTSVKLLSLSCLFEVFSSLDPNPFVQHKLLSHFCLISQEHQSLSGVDTDTTKQLARQKH